jgi:hypothetical protein
MQRRNCWFPKMSLKMWIIHMRRFMEWRKKLKYSHPSEMAESAPQKLID